MNDFPKANSFDINLVRSKIMGPNPLKLCEELLRDANIAKGSRVCDLSSGTGVRFGLSADSAFRWSVDGGGGAAFFDARRTWWRSRPSCFEPHVQN